MAFRINKSNEVYFIAEAGLNHNGKIEIAHNLIDVACTAGAHAIKFQKRTISELATKEVLDTQDNRFPFLGKTYREIRENLEFSYDQYKELLEHAKSLDLDFIVTPFDIKAVEFLAPLNLDVYKIASHSVRNLDLIKRISETGKPIILSTGMSTIDEIDTAVDVINKSKVDLYLLHCVSSYPTEDKDINLRTINFLQDRYKVIVGYSGHEIDDLASTISVALGSRIIERHITLNRNLEGFDHKLSLEPEELKILIEKIRRIEQILGSSEKKLLSSELIARNKYNVSMVSLRSIKKGALLLEQDITWKNPGTGISRAHRDEYLGRHVLADIEPDILLRPEMFE
jgi:sialic acid synthase SpsE